jgi:dGTPase
MQAQIAELKRFLMRNLYRHAQVMEMTDRARRVVTDLYAAYNATPHEMPDAVRHSAELAGIGVRRCVADYIAGMTDRFAIREHRRLTGLHLF